VSTTGLEDNKMTFFIAIHKWKREDDLVVSKDVLKAIQSIPKDLCLCASYVGELEAWCIYEAKSKEAGELIEKFFEENVPKMETEVKPVLQFAPPSKDLYVIMYNLLKSTV